MEKQLYRSRNNRMIAGVAGGLSEYFNIEPTIVRILFLIGALANGGGVFIYILLIILVPEEPRTETTTTTVEGTNNEPIGETEPQNRQPAPSSPESNNTRIFGGTILVLLGVLFLLNEVVPALSFGKLWPLLLVIIGGLLLFRKTT